MVAEHHLQQDVQRFIDNCRVSSEKIDRHNANDVSNDLTKIKRGPIMYRFVLLFIITGLICWSGNIGAKEINLNAGEIFHQGDLTVTCGLGQASTDPTALAIKDCQYWDDFDQKCLFEKTTYVYKNIECIEECQHWDEFNSTCHYRNTCTFYPSQKSFVKTTCERFDDFKKTCLQTKDTKISR